MIARSVEPLQKLKEQYSKQVEVLNGDLADLSIGQKAVDLALKSFGRLDGMVLNHGVLGQVGKIAQADPEQWKHGFDVNFISFVAFVSSISFLTRCQGGWTLIGWVDQSWSSGASRYEGQACLHFFRCCRVCLQRLGSVWRNQGRDEPSCA